MNRLLLAAALTLTLPAFSHAATPQKGWYLGLGAGWNQANDAGFDRAGVTNNASYDAGWVAQGSVGYDYGNNWRSELELGYRRNTVDNITGTGTTTSKGGEFKAFSVMGNALYDFHNDTDFTPYLGLGLGASFQNAEDIGNVFAANTRIDKKDTVFAYQGIAGLDYSLDEVNRLGLRYVYHGSADGDFATTAGTSRGTNGEYGNHSLLLSYRVSLSTPAPAPASALAPAMPAAPAAVPVAPVVRYSIPSEAMIEASPYKVFFANDSALIDAAGQQVIRDAATRAQNADVQVVHLASNTDTTASASHNERLSLRRAHAVKTALLAAGVAGDKIKLISNAERNLPIPTADNVAEPRNRVVTLVVQ